MITRLISTLMAAAVAFSSPGAPAFKADPAGIVTGTKADHMLIVGAPSCGIAYASTAMPSEVWGCAKRRRRRAARPDA